ncbi:MAG: hypothetical protein AB7O92_23280 [Acidimicrobiia bacterium]
MTTRKRRAQAILAALGSLLTLTTLAAGVPLALWALAGSPFPDQLPAFDDLTKPISDGAFISVIALLGWLGWTQIAASILLESAAWIRGVQAPRLPAAGAIQPTIRKLIATTALLLSNPNVSAIGIAAASGPPPQVVVEPIHMAVSTPTMFLADTGDGALTDQQPSELSYIVQRRDTLWGLAERHLGDPFRWPELFDLNHGRLQADGRRLTDPNLIVIGWTLVFPTDAVGIEAAAPAPAGPMEAPVGEAPSPGPDVPPTAETPELVPTPTAPAPTTAPTSAPAPSSTAPSVVDDIDRDPSAIDLDEDDNGWQLAPVIGGPLLAAAVIVLIDRLRRARLRQRRRQSVTPLSEELQRTEIQLRASADVGGARRLDLGLRAFAAGLHRQRGPVPQVLAVRIDGDTLEVLLDEAPATPPAGFEPTGDARGWRLAEGLTDEDLGVLANGSVAPLPALVTAGTADGDPVLIDIEAGAVVTIGGPTDDVRKYLRRVAVELSTSTWTDHLDILTIGEPLGDLSGTQRVRHHANLDEAVASLRSIGAATARELDDAGHGTTIAARVAGDHGDGWIPTVLIVSSPIDPQLLDELASALQPSRGVALVAPGSVPTRGWHINLDGAQCTLAPHNLTLQSVTLDDTAAEAIDQILTDLAVDAEPAELIELAPSVAPESSPPGPAELEPFSEPTFDVEVRVLGAVEIVGVAPIGRRKSLEIAAYLALHPEGVSDDKLKTVFWPDAVPSQSTFNTSVSMVRSALGADPKGELYLPHFASSGQRYRLSEKVTTDFARLQQRLDWCKTATDDQARPVLEEALRLVRGQPFDVGRGYEWAFAECLVTRSALAVVAAADRLACIALDSRDHELAEWAATQGLLASPGDEALYRHRMTAAHLAGNHAAVRQLMTELCEVVEANEPFDQLQPETVELLNQLAGKPSSIA